MRAWLGMIAVGYIGLKYVQVLNVSFNECIR